MLVWFVAIGVLGLRGIMRAPAILAALSPLHALSYLIHAGPGVSFRRARRRLPRRDRRRSDVCRHGPFRPAAHPPWLVRDRVAGPGAQLFRPGRSASRRPRAVENPFYLLAPDGLHYPLVAFATLATIIASQAIISGAYSLTQQAIQLGFLPRMRVLHTASHEKGQIYMPMVNWPLAVGTSAPCHASAPPTRSGAPTASPCPC